MKNQELLKNVLTLFKEGLFQMGMHEDRGVFLYPLNQDVIGWIGLNTSRRRGDGMLGINPIAGVRHEQIERIVSHFLGTDGVPRPTLSSSIGYLMPELKYMEWLFPSKIDFDSRAEVERALTAIRIYGRSFFQNFSEIGSIIEALEEVHFCDTQSAMFRLPAAYIVAGRYSLARKSLERFTEGLNGRNDAAAEAFRQYVTGLKENYLN